MSDRPYNVPFDLILKLPAATGKYSFEGLITKLLGVLAWRQQSIAEASSHSFHKYYLNFLEDNEDTI